MVTVTWRRYNKVKVTVVVYVTTEQRPRLWDGEIIASLNIYYVISCMDYENDENDNDGDDGGIVKLQHAKEKFVVKNFNKDI